MGLSLKFREITILLSNQSSLITLERPRTCYECDLKRKTGRKFNCKTCNESHFVCSDCIPTYLKYEPESNYLENEYSKLTIKESQ